MTDDQSWVAKKQPKATPDQVAAYSKFRNWPIERTERYFAMTDALLISLQEKVVVEHLGLQEQQGIFVVDEEGMLKLDSALTSLAEVLGKIMGLAYSREPELIPQALETVVTLISAGAAMSMESCQQFGEQFGSVPH
jgi:hypothetical protein